VDPQAKARAQRARPGKDVQGPPAAGTPRTGARRTGARGEATRPRTALRSRARACAPWRCVSGSRQAGLHPPKAGWSRPGRPTLSWGGRAWDGTGCRVSCTPPRHPPCLRSSLSACLKKCSSVATAVIHHSAWPWLPNSQGENSEETDGRPQALHVRATDSSQLLPPPACPAYLAASCCVVVATCPFGAPALWHMPRIAALHAWASTAGRCERNTAYSLSYRNPPSVTRSQEMVSAAACGL